MLCTIIFFIFGCSKNSEPLSSNEQKESFGIFFLKDSSLTGNQAAQIDINQLDLREQPWLTNDDIQFYDFSSHCIYLKEDKSKFFKNYGGKFYQFSPVLINRPFVVVANKERCYVGSLHSDLLSLSPAGPYMDELDVGFYPEDVMHISKALSSGNDVRNDSRIEDALNSLSLYHGGISVDLKSVNVIENSDTSTVEYVITIRNLDHDNLFVIDPDKMGVDLFHYFTNGIVFHGNDVIFQSTYKKTVSPTVSWDAKWFTELPVNTSIERTIRLRGYPRITPGKYSCSFTLANPNVEKENRYISGGRIWLGEVESSKTEIEIQ